MTINFCLQVEELQAVRGELRRKVVEVIQLLDDGVPTEDTLDTMIYKLDWVHAMLVRLSRVQYVSQSIFNQVISTRGMLLEYFTNTHLTTTTPNYMENVHQERGRGRPSFDISMETLEDLLSRNFTVPEIASLFNVSVRTIRNRMTTYNLAVGDFYTQMTDDEVDGRVSDILGEFPNCG